MSQDDPYIWLEEIDSPRALDWVRARNEETLPLLESDPHFEDYVSRALAILNDTRKIAYPDACWGDGITNFWQDDRAVRGLWRRAARADYINGTPTWETLIDIDALARAEGRNWVWKGAQALGPAYERCLIFLSDGGKDAVEVREFDLRTAQFVPDGFHIPEAKHNVAWWDADQLIVGTDWGPGSLTTSGYPRQLKLWRRGTPLESATSLGEAPPTSVALRSMVHHTRERRDRALYESITFWSGALVHIRGDIQTDGAHIPSPLPKDADIQSMAGGRVFAILRSPWRGFAAGTLVAYAIDPLLSTGDTPVECIYKPVEHSAIAEVRITRTTVYVVVLKNVTSELYAITRTSTAWRARRVRLPQMGTLSLLTSDPESDLIFVHTAGFTVPDQLYSVGAGQPHLVATRPARFDPHSLRLTQHFATSADGTRVPYFVIRPKGKRGPLPTWMYGYGGFEISLTPAYIGPAVQFWLEEGGQYVVCNIRGGGEFGPAWHQAALKENRQRAYDDFHSIAEDLITRKQTTAAQLGIHGGSNGGLLVGVAYTQRPDLYGAVLMGVPLADMKRYTKLLAGASWMGEYGDPDNPSDWAYIQAYSPYHHIHPDVTYPKVFLFTSTKDDRVHPAHARKMAARMQRYGKPVYYYENIDGGHAGVANLRETAHRMGLFLAYWNRELKGGGQS